MPRRRIKAIDSLIGQRVRALRLKQRYTQGDLGKVLDVTFQQIQKFEKGDNRLSGSQLYTLAKFFNVPIATLFPPLHAKLEALNEEGGTGGFT
jgi:transcriptional regulator with XRE-family HTH domain